MALRLVVTCEHGGNRIPRPYWRLFRDHARLLDSHRGYDPGSLDLARLLARRFDAPLLFSTVSRLFVELNRSPWHRALFSELTRALPRAERESILAHHYHPHRRRVERCVARDLERGHEVLHVASHSFSPSLRGELRRADVSWLYDPRRPAEKGLCSLWRSALAAARPDLRLRFNYPYRGAADGLTSHLRRRFGVPYLGVELEVNQSWHYGEPRECTRLRRALGDSLGRAFSEWARSGSRGRGSPPRISRGGRRGRKRPD